MSNVRTALVTWMILAAACSLVAAESVSATVNGKGWRPLRSLVQAEGVAPVCVKEASSVSGTMVMTYAIPDVEVVLACDRLSQMSGEDVQDIKAGNAPAAGAPGLPVLPIIPARVILPSGTALDRVEVMPGSVRTMPGRHTVRHGQEDHVVSSRGPARMTPRNEEVYSSDDQWPGRAYEIVGIQKKRGVSFLLVNLFPVQYCPASGTLLYSSEMTLTVTTKPCENEAVQTAGVGRPTISTKPVSTNLRFRKDSSDTLARMADNPHAFSSYEEMSVAPLAAEASPADADAGGSVAAASLPAGNFKYVIITSRALRDATTDYTVRDLIAHRQAQGVTATNMAVEDIYASYTGVDNPEKIRNFIKDAYSAWSTDYVLLGGDTNIVPLRVFRVSPLMSGLVPSDVYYQCLDGSMNGNENEYWGEPDDGAGGTDVDLMADVYVGRASAENATEMANFVYKTLAYENDSDLAAYKHAALLVGEWLGWREAEYAEPFMEELRLGSTNNGYTTVGFASDTANSVADTCYEPYEQVSETNMLREINRNAYGMFSHFGHGFYTGTMGIHLDDSGKMSNTKYFFMYSQACFTGGFDWPCFAEFMTTSERHGCFATIMNTRQGWGVTGQMINRHFWDGYFGQKNIRTLGELNADSHESVLWYLPIIGGGGTTLRHGIYCTTLFGDPMTRFPEPARRMLQFDKSEYFCGDWATVTMTSTSLVGMANQAVAVATSAGDHENLLLYPTGAGSSTFTNRIRIAYGAALLGNGTIEGQHGTELTAIGVLPGAGLSVTGYAAINLQLQITITTPPLTVPMQMSSTPIAGINNGNVAVSMSVVNEATGASGVFSATNAWVAPAVSLTNGLNRIWVSGTNAYGFTGSNFVMITRVGPSGATNYVSPAGAHIWPFTSWANAATSIMAAVNAVYASNVVLVADGTYKGTEITLSQPIHIKSLNGAAGAVIDGDAKVRCLQVTDNALVEGFTLANGYADQGAGAYLLASGTLKDCVISGNRAENEGGGVYLYGGGVVRNCMVVSNTAAVIGGGVYFYESGVVYDSVIRANQASMGGGLALTQNGGVVSNSVISGNFASGVGGGGAYLENYARIVSSLIEGNESANDGGGAYCFGGGDLDNCTVIGNYAQETGGGIRCFGPARIRNSIVYFNEALSGANYSSVSGASYLNCCTTPLPTGTGHVTNAPQIVGVHDAHLLPVSPCINVGSNGYFVSGTDIDGEGRITNGRVDIGCDEYVSGALTGALSSAIADGVRTAVTGYTLELMSDARGRANKLVWDFGDGVTLTNQTVVTHAWSSGGDYTVRLTAFNTNFPSGVSATTIVHVLSGVTNYVSLAGGHVAPFTSWATAATNIQAAIEASPEGGSVLVADGIYSAGCYIKEGSTNRVGLYKPVKVKSVNGPAHSTITGHGGWSDNPVRCAYLVEGAELSGFTLSNGYTRNSGSWNAIGGGGAFLDCGGVVSNCVITACGGYWGGGACLYYGGSLVNCVVYGNKSYYEGTGVYLYYGGKMANCIVRDNTGGEWSPASAVVCNNGGEVNNCTVIRNPLGLACNYYGNYVTIRNTIIYGNPGGNWINSGTGITYAACCTTPLVNGIGNFTNDPLITAVGRLSTASRCIDAGTSASAPALDIDGKSRWDHPSRTNVSSIIDIGADEYVDSDLNGLPDWWEVFYFGVIGQGQSSDSESDGLNNLAEYFQATNPREADTDGDEMRDGDETIAGTDPNSAGSVLRMSNTVYNAAVGKFVVYWPSVAGRFYAVQAATNLVHGFTINVRTNIPATPPENVHTDSVEHAETKFYRISVE